ncbi:MAG: chemotaxis protein CheW [Thermincola sp.]|jgi:purine-binding chemotaxis protein CheW|nr:chemotaxis protein CheW [Thermincola sp.]MDT3702481.1 chemotaxis protein CheW [Thermincola sp.]
MASNERLYVIFRLGVEDFGLEINKIKEIIVFRETTNVPGSGELIEGIINLRGQVIPIFNLRRKFALPIVEYSRNTRMVVVEISGHTVGIVVDGVSKVMVITEDVIEKPSSLITAKVDSNYISGVAKLGEKLVILLSLDRVLNIEATEAV